MCVCVCACVRVCVCVCVCSTNSPLNLCQQEVHVMTSFLTRFKNGFTFIKEQDGVIDLGLSENELEILSSRHGAKRGEVDQENLGK